MTGKMNKQKVGELARKLKLIEVTLEQIVPIYVETGLPSEYAFKLGILEEVFLDAADGLVQICKQDRLISSLVTHHQQVFNLEQIEAWADDRQDE